MAEIKALYLDGVIWHTNHFQAIIDWFNPDEDTTTAATTTVTDAPTDPPTTQPTQSTDAPSSAPTTAFLSFGIAVVCLVLNLWVNWPRLGWERQRLSTSCWMTIFELLLIVILNEWQNKNWFRSVCLKSFFFGGKWWMSWKWSPFLDFLQICWWHFCSAKWLAFENGRKWDQTMGKIIYTKKLVIGRHLVRTWNSWLGLFVQHMVLGFRSAKNVIL